MVEHRHGGTWGRPPSWISQPLPWAHIEGPKVRGSREFPNTSRRRHGQRLPARLAAQDVTNAAMSVAEGMTRFTAQLNADDRRLKVPSPPHWAMARRCGPVWHGVCCWQVERMTCVGTCRNSGVHNCHSNSLIIACAIAGGWLGLTGVCIALPQSQ